MTHLNKAARFGDRWWNPAMYSVLIAIVVVGGWWWGGRVHGSDRTCDGQELCADPGWTVAVTIPVSLVLLAVVVVSRPIRPMRRAAMAGAAALGSLGFSRSLGPIGSAAIAAVVAALTMLPRRGKMNFGG